MKKIVYLKNVDELEQIIGNNLVYLGAGAEGITYLSKKDNKAYKILTDFEIEDDVEDIITSRDIDLKHFLFPEELYVYDGHLIAYRTKYVNNNLIDFTNRKNNIFIIDFDKFIKAYYEMLKEIKILSDNKIKIYDLSFNLMFDGENLYAIDTCGYRKVDEDVNEVYRHNKFYLEEAIKDILSAFLINDISTEEYNKLVDIQDLEEQLKEIKIIARR